MDTFVNVEYTDSGKQVKFIDGRCYTKDNVHYYPGVTTILQIIAKGKQYDTWLKSVGFNSEYLSRQAMEQGSKVHSAIQDLLNGLTVDYGTIEGGAKYTQHEWTMISRFIDFYTEFKPETIEVEKVLVSDKLKFGTQLDYVCRLNGEVVIIDHKTGNLYDSANLQLAACVNLWNECYPSNKVKKAFVMHLEALTRGRDKKGESTQGHGWKLVPVDNLEQNWEDFKHAHSLWIRANPDFKPFNHTYPATYKL
jgi:hypothetical protein